MIRHRPLQYLLFRFNKLSQANKRQKSFRKNKKKRRDVERIFHTKGQGTISISGDRKRTKPKRQKKLNKKCYANIKRIQQQKSTGQHELYLIASSFPRRATWSTKTAAIFNETNNDSERHMSALLPTPANEKKSKGETELRTNTGHQSTQQHQQQLANLAHKSLPPISPFACSPITATRARTRHYTASLLLSNKRVRGVVHGGC